MDLTAVCSLLSASILTLKRRVGVAGGRDWLGPGVVAKEVKRVSVAGSPSVAVESDAGSISFRAGVDGEVKIDAEMHVRTRADLGEVRFEVEYQNNIVRILNRCTKGRSENCSVDFVVYAPKDSELHAETGAGNVEASCFTGGLRARTGGGCMTTSHVAGELILSTSGGDIRCSDVIGSLVLSTGAGNIEAAGSLTGASKLSTRGGYINAFNVDGSIEARTEAGSIAVKGALRGENRISTGAGNVLIALEDSSSVVLHASTNVGIVTSQFGLSSADRRSVGAVVDAAIGAGDEGRVCMHTDVGDIEICRRGRSDG